MEDTICVIGAGCAGLSAIKGLKEEGFTNITCYEMADTIGGLWNYTDELKPNHRAGIHKRLYTNTDKETTCFSDFPFPDEDTAYVSHEQFMDYVHHYAKAFDLGKHVTFNTRVLAVRRNDDFERTGRWQVTYQTKGHDATDRVFDRVVVCSGFFSKAVQPDVPGLDTFPGRVITAADFRRGEDYEGKRVLVVGNGLSAADVVGDVAHFAKMIYIAVGEGTWVYPRFLPNCEPTIFLITRKFVYWTNPLKANRSVEKLLNTFLDHYKMNIANPKGPVFSHVMISSVMPALIGNGQLKVKGHLESFSGSQAVFRDGSLVNDIDDVVFACGYTHNYPFLEKDLVGDDLCETNMYKQVWPFESFLSAAAEIQRHPTLAVVGCMATNGAMLPLFELQTRWIARVFSGKNELPPSDVMRKDGRAFWAGLRAQWGKNKLFLPAIVYMDQIADFIGCKPNIWRYLLSDPQVGWRLIYQPIFSCQWRLQGPHKWDKARERYLGAYDRVVNATKHGARHVTKPASNDWSKTRALAVIVGACLVAYYARQYQEQLTEAFKLAIGQSA